MPCSFGREEEEGITKHLARHFSPKFESFHIYKCRLRRDVFLAFIPALPILFC